MYVCGDQSVSPLARGPCSLWYQYYCRLESIGRYRYLPSKSWIKPRMKMWRGYRWDIPWIGDSIFARAWLSPLYDRKRRIGTYWLLNGSRASKPNETDCSIVVMGHRCLEYELFNTASILCLVLLLVEIKRHMFRISIDGTKRTGISRSA